MRALVIGADGFAGRWLLRHLVDSGDDVTAAVGPHYADDTLPHDLEAHRVDVRDADGISQLVRASRPDAIYYLAGISRAGDRDDLTAAIRVSVQGALNVLAAAADAATRPVRLLHVGSSHMYAPSPDGTPITEDAPIRPTTVYGAVKAAAEAALLHLGPASGVKVVAVRAFNHIGPGQDAGFVVPSLAQQVAAIRRREQDPVIRAGDLEVERDFTDVRDVVRAYRFLAVQGRSGEAYNVASGRATSVAIIIRLLCSIAGLTATTEQDARLRRPHNPARIIGSSAKLQAETGWQPEIELSDTLRDVIGAS